MQTERRAPSLALLSTCAASTHRLGRDPERAESGLCAHLENKTVSRRKTLTLMIMMLAILMHMTLAFPARPRLGMSQQAMRCSDIRAHNVLSLQGAGRHFRLRRIPLFVSRPRECYLRKRPAAAWRRRGQPGVSFAQQVVGHGWSSLS